jgi:SAM-dependent methyltransferase
MRWVHPENLLATVSAELDSPAPLALARGAGQAREAAELPTPWIQTKPAGNAFPPAGPLGSAPRATGGPARVDGRYYQVAPSQSFAERLVIRARDRIYQDFLRLCRPSAQDSILDVGVSDVTNDAANVLERRYAHPERLTAAGLGEGTAFRDAFPAVRYVQIAPNQPLPYADASLDIVTANAVLEHVGSVADQIRFVADLMRVGRRVFITVPHRFFPVEHHTAIPFLHWSDLTFAAACRLFGKQEWSLQKNLILMSQARLRRTCPPGADVHIGKTGIVLGPCSANLYLYWERVAA